MSWLAVGEELDGDGRAFPNLASDVDGALMALDNAMRDRQTKPRAFARLLGRKERKKDLLERLGGDPTPGVFNAHQDLPIHQRGAEHQLPSIRHRLNRVDEEIDKNLGELIVIPQDHWQGLRIGSMHLEVLVCGVIHRIPLATHRGIIKNIV